MSYIPNTNTDRSEMLATIGVASLDALFDQIPKLHQFQGLLNILPRLDQISLMRHLTTLPRKNVHADDFSCFLG